MVRVRVKPHWPISLSLFFIFLRLPEWTGLSQGHIWVRSWTGSLVVVCPLVLGSDSRRMKYLFWSLFQIQIDLYLRFCWGPWRCLRVSSLHSHREKAVLVSCTWAASDSKSALTQEHSADMWTYTGLGAMACQTPDTYFLRAGGALRGLAGSFISSKWAVVDGKVSDKTTLGLWPCRQASAAFLFRPA